MTCTRQSVYWKIGGITMQLIQTPSKLGMKTKHIAKLLELEHVRTVNIQMKKDEEIAEHESSKDVVIVVRDGAVLFTVEGVETRVTKDNVLYMQPKEKHSLKAMEDSDLLVFQITPE